MSPRVGLSGGNVIQGYFPGGLPGRIDPMLPAARQTGTPAARGWPGTPPTSPVRPSPHPPAPLQQKPAQPRLGGASGPIHPPSFGAVPPNPGRPQHGILPGPALAQSVQPATGARHLGAIAVQRLSGNTFALPPTFALKPHGTGQRLPEPVQRKMEAFFGADFSDVMVHIGPEAPSIGALAFTHGSDLYFAPGQYRPTTSEGQRLLGHELTHVLQQQAGRVRNAFGSGLAVVQDQALEAEAERMGQRAATFVPPVQAKMMPPGPGASSPRTRDGPAPCAIRLDAGRPSPDPAHCRPSDLTRPPPGCRDRVGPAETGRDSPGPNPGARCDTSSRSHPHPGPADAPTDPPDQAEHPAQPGSLARLPHPPP